MKKRLDVLVFERGFCESRERARALIMSGAVYVDSKRADKPGLNVSEDAGIEVRGGDLKYVSRGGLKLERAIEYFKIDLTNLVCMDVGASTGGFTDVMLQNGAQKIYCVDVGYGQLAWKLRTDERCVVMEKTNIRNVRREDIGELPDFVSIDVSFISLRLVLPVIYGLLKEKGTAVALIKPQFEAGKEEVGKRGVVKEKAIHKKVIENVASLSQQAGFSVLGLTFSPIKGPEGNIEFLIYLGKNIDPASQIDAGKIVNNAHEALIGVS